MVATAKAPARRGLRADAAFPGALHPRARDAGRLDPPLPGEAGVKQGLLLAGGIATPRGEYHSSMQLLESGFFDDAGFTHLHVAGHPEGNRTSTPMAARPRSWRAALEAGFRQPHRRVVSPSPRNSPSRPRCGGLGRAAGGRGHRDAGASGRRGPAKLQTLIKFAIACGVGKSLGVLQKRAKDVTKLLLPFEPTEFMADLAARKAAGSGHEYRAHPLLPARRDQGQCRMGDDPWRGCGAQPAAAASVA
jgi:methylenetetrahydrofolate reductase (NADPH)